MNINKKRAVKVLYHWALLQDSEIGSEVSLLRFREEPMVKLLLLSENRLGI
jgi:hypothetical protein